MALTQAQAVGKVRERIDEPSESFWKDYEIRGWLNEGVAEVARRAEWNRAASTITVTAGTQVYVCPTDLIRAYRVEYQPTSSSIKYPLEYRDFNQMDVLWGLSQSITTSIPEFWTSWLANPISIHIAPIPAIAGQLNLFYYAMPTDLATHDNSDSSVALSVPAGWEDLPVEWATSLAFRKDRHPEMYQMAKAAFEETISEFIQASARWTDAPTMITEDYVSGMTDEYWGGY